jgi:hypothetical protein
MWRRVIKCPLQKRKAGSVQCDTWMSKIGSTRSSSVGFLSCVKCFSHSINRSKFKTPDSEISGKGPGGPREDVLVSFIYTKAGGYRL